MCPTEPTASAVLRLISVVLIASLNGAPVAAAAQPAEISRAREKEASIVAKQALGFYLKKKYTLAAELYRRAAEIDPTKPDYHYATGRCEQRSGRLEQARAAFERVLAMGKPTDAFSMKARAQLEAVRKAEAKQAEVAKRDADAQARQVQIDADKRAREAAVAAERAAAEAPKVPRSDPAESADKAAPPAPGAAGTDTAGGAVHPAAPGTSVDTTVGEAATAPRRWVVWSVAGVGGAALITGGALLMLAVGDQGSLDALRNEDGKFDATRIDLPTARARQSAINDKIVGGWVSLGAGAAIAAAGSYLLLRNDAPRAVLLPRANGMTFAMRF